jgi:hypothetical protein
MNVAHEVLISSRHTTTTLSPQSVDPANLLRPAALLLNNKSTDFELASVEQNDSGKLIMQPLTGK